MRLQGKSLPLPCEKLHHNERNIVGHLLVGSAIVHSGQGMGKGVGWGPGHGKDHVKRNTKLLSAVNMGHGRRVGNDDIGDEELIGVLDCGGRDGIAHAVASLDTAAPAAIDDFRHLITALANITGLDTRSIRQQTGISDHVRHESFWVTTNTKELDSLVFNEVLENGMGADAHPVVKRGLREALGNGNKGLDIATGANNVDGDVKAGTLGVFALRASGEVGRRLAGCLQERFIWRS